MPAAKLPMDGDFGDTPTLFTGTVKSGGSSRSLIGVANKNGRYYVFNAHHISRGPVATLRIAKSCGNPESGCGSVSPSAYDGKYLYIAGGGTTIGGVTYKGSIRAFDPNNLTTAVWANGFSAGPDLGAVAADPTVVVAGAGAFSTVMDSSTGSVLFQDAEPGFYGAPSIAYGVVYEGDTAGSMHAYSVNGL